MSCKKIVILLGAVLASFFLLKSDARPLADNNKNSIVEDKFWAAEELATMAKTKTMEDAVSFLTSGAVRATGTPNLQLDEIKKIVDGKATADLRAALVMATGVEGRRKTKDDKQIVEFAGTDNAAATCAAEHTAGGQGVDTCIDACEKKSTYLKRSSRRGACYMLCTVATSPCATKEPFSWKQFAKSWTQKTIEWIGTTLQGAWKMVKVVDAMSLSGTKFLALSLLGLVNRWRGRPGFRKWRKHVFKTKKRQRVDGKDRLKMKGIVLAKTHARLHQKKALYVWHDSAALATYRASQKAAKAKARQEAIDEVAAEQGTRDKGDGGACMLS